MAKRTRAASAHVAPAQETELEQTGASDGEDDAHAVDAQGDSEPTQPIRFRQALSWHAGQAIPTAELLKRLQSLAIELKDFDQEVIDKSSLGHVAQELASPNLLRHKDKGVKAWAAHCLVDILRLAAPDAPFSRPQLQDIFTLFVSTSIPQLADSTDAYYGQNLHVLNTLLLSKAIVLITDVGSSSKLIVSLFSSCFDILSQSGEAVSKNLEYNLTGLLQCMVEECDGLPNEVVETILAQFMRADQSRSATVPSTAPKGKKQPLKPEPDATQTRLQLKQLPPAYGVAQNICNTGVERMSRHVAQYFSNVILGASGGGTALATTSRSKNKKRSDTDDIDEEDDQHGPSKEDIEQLEKAHKLLRELWKTCPGVLHSVIPQLEAELSAEKLELRRIATQAIGDMISGIGVESSLPQAILDPVAYPPLSFDADRPGEYGHQDSRAPKATQSLSQTHSAAYQSFLGRRNDKSPEVRAAWTTGIGRVLSTSAGGIGLSPQDQQDLVRYLSQMLIDSDEKVRTAAIQSLALLDFSSFVSKIGSSQRSADFEPIMNQLADRAKDKDPTVRLEAAHFLGRLWGVGAHEIAAGNQQVIDLLGDIPSKILNGRYANKLEINALIDRVLFESLIPLGYPVQKKRAKRPTGSNDQGDEKIKELSDGDADIIRVERLLVLFHGLDERAKKALLAIMGMPVQMAKVMKQYLKFCEDYNGNTMDKDDSETRKKLGKVIDYMAQFFPDAPRLADDLWTFADKNDRRSYVLIRFCMAEESDYRKIYKSIKELLKRLDALSLGATTIPQTLTSILYRVSNLFYNKSHVSPIMELSCQDGSPLKHAAQEVLNDLSTRAPGIFKTNGQDLSAHVEESAPTASRTNDPGALATLKTYAGFARNCREDVPKDKKFVSAMMRYVQRGSPPSAAKYAVAIIMLSTDKKEMHAKDILRECTRAFKYGGDYFLSKLAALSQLMLLYASEMDEEKEVDVVLQIAIKDVLARPSPKNADTDSPAFIQDIEARGWALKIIANRLRSYPDAMSVKNIKDPVYQVLTKLIEDAGILEKITTPNEVLKSRLRLQAAKLLIQLSSHRDFDVLLSPKAFNSILRLAQDADLEVRKQFVTKVKKYLGQGRLSTRFYNVVFLLAFEPSKVLKDESAVWLHSRATQLAKSSNRFPLEMAFSRFISVLAHHPDYSDGMEVEDVDSLIQYMMFYLKNVATADNISLIYSTAQRVKTVQDGIDPRASERLYYLADLAVVVINSFSSIHNWSLQARGGKVGIPNGIFAAIKDHDEAQTIIETQYLSSEAAELVEASVRSHLRGKKRKSEHELENPGKRKAGKETSDAGNGVRAKAPAAGAKKSGGQKTGVKTPGKSRARTDASDEDEDDDEAQTSGRRSTSERASRRHSSRAAGKKSYAEADDDDDDAEMEEWEVSPSGNKENRSGMEVD